MQRIFCCDDKYSEVVRVLTERGWTRLPLAHNGKKAILPRDAELVWTHLHAVCFEAVFGRVVNHMKGSQHWSNKAFLLRHLYASDLALCPPSWSPACHDIPHLLHLLFLDHVYSTAKQYLLSSHDQSSDSSFASTLDLLRKLHHRMLVIHKNGTNPPKIVDEPFERLLQSLLFSPSLQREQLQNIVAEIEVDEPWRKFCGDQRIWILKPVGASCGTDIVIAKGIHDVMRMVEEQFRYKCVVQKYIERPLLVRNRRKFDIRQWVLLTSINPLVVYGFSEFYLRLSTAEYTVTDISSRQVHLCNHSVQTQYLVDNDLSSHCDNMMSKSDFIETLADLGYSSGLIEDFFRRLKHTCVTTVEAVRDRVERVGKGFEWLGFDLMVTELLDVLLIEVNVSPDISPSTSITKPLVYAAINDLMTMIEGESVLEGSSASYNTSRAAGVKDPSWHLWHVGDGLSAIDLRRVENEKRKRLEFDSEYSPKNIDICSGLLQFIGNPQAHSEQEEEEL